MKIIMSLANENFKDYFNVNRMKKISIFPISFLTSDILLTQTHLAENNFTFNVIFHKIM